MLSTLDNLTKAQDETTDVDAVFFDLSKAFDNLLIFKLPVFITVLLSG